MPYPSIFAFFTRPFHLLSLSFVAHLLYLQLEIWPCWEPSMQHCLLSTYRQPILGMVEEVILSLARVLGSLLFRDLWLVDSEVLLIEMFSAGLEYSGWFITWTWLKYYLNLLASYLSKISHFDLTALLVHYLGTFIIKNNLQVRFGEITSHQTYFWNGASVLIE